MDTAVRLSTAELVDRARALIASGDRRILGICGAPGAGKSTVSAALLEALGDRAVLVPMDGYHLSNEVLVALGRRDRKGAPDTFDADGYVALLARLHRQTDDVVYAPRFHREIEESIAAEIAVPRSTPLVITEGNYLLLDSGPWRHVRPMLDEAWFVTPGDDVRQERLIARHVAYGKHPDAARDWALGTDERNAEIINATAGRADLVVRID